MGDPAPTAGALFSAAAETYDGDRRTLLPDFDRLYGAVLQPLRGLPGDAAILDLGAGTGLLSAMVRKQCPDAHLTVTDLVPAMVEKAAERFASDPRTRVHALDLRSDPLPGEQDAVISSLAIHHLEDAQKVDLFAQVFAALKPGGLFVNLDQFRDPDPTVDAGLHAAWLEAVRAAGATEAAIGAALERMTADRNARLDDQVRWLEEAGFATVTVSERRHFFMVLSAGKAGGSDQA
ncbi:MAG: methyltransferase domain-containing protein [Pseudomonadota bacterium]